MEQHLIAQEELFQAEVTLATNENSLADTETSYENTKDQFKQTLGLPLDIDISILPNIQIDSVHVDVNQAVKYALTQRMEIRQQQIAIEEGIFSLIEAKDNNKFKGSISARVGLMGQGDKFNGAFSKPDDNETIGVTLTVPIWDWGAKKGKYSQYGIIPTKTRRSATRKKENPSCSKYVRFVESYPNYYARSKSPARQSEMRSARTTSTSRNIVAEPLLVWN